MDDSRQELTKSRAVIRGALIICCTIALSAGAYYLMYGRVPSVKYMLFASIVIVPVMVIGMIRGFKNRTRLTKDRRHRSKFGFITIILGTLLAINNAALVAIGDTDIMNFINIGVGILLLHFGYSKIKST